MSEGTKYQDDQIRRDLGLAGDAPLNDGIRSIMAKPKDEAIKSKLLNMGVSAEDFTEYCKLFAQGMQWVQQKYSHVRGPRVVELGYPEDPINVTYYDGNKIELDDPKIGNKIAHRGLESADPQLERVSVILVPFADVKTFSDTINFERLTGGKQVVRFTAKSRKVIGDKNIKESIFIDGVEEAYHAVQHLDRELSNQLKRKSVEEALYINISTYDASEDVAHETFKERAAVPVLMEALKEFRDRQAQRSGLAGGEE